MNESNKVAYHKVYEQITAIAIGLNRHEKELLFKLLQAQLDWESSLESPVNQEVKVKIGDSSDLINKIFKNIGNDQPVVKPLTPVTPIMYPEIHLKDVPKPLDVRYSGETESLR